MRYFIGIVIGLTILMSATVLFFSFVNYTISIHDTQTSIQKIRSALVDSKKADKKTKWNRNYEEIVKAENKLISSLYKVKNNIFNNGTISFLFTIFSILFISIGFYIHSKTNEKLGVIENNLKLVDWSVTSSNLSTLFLAMDSISFNGTYANRSKIADTLVECRELFNETLISMEINKRFLGTPKENLSLWEKLLDRIEKSIKIIYQGEKKYLDRHVASNIEAEIDRLREGELLFLEKIEHLRKILREADFEKRWKRAQNGKIEM
jgi:hypothetical protein